LYSCKRCQAASAKAPIAGAGDIWTWTAICADTKLIPSWVVGNRDSETAKRFIDDLAARLKNKVQLTNDGHKSYLYLEAVESAFGGNIDYAVLVKIYSEAPTAEKRYSSSNYMRVGMRRFTRLTNAFSKKAENHSHAIALHFMHYNFGRIHKTLRVTPAMEAGVSDHVWSLEEIATLAGKNSN